MERSPDLSPWPGLKLIAEVAQGNRNQVWQGVLDGHMVSVRRSRRSSESLAWELDLISYLAGQDFWVPQIIRTRDDRHAADGIVVQRWLDGTEPRSDEDWTLVAHELQRLHVVGASYPQRPGCCVIGELVNQRRSVDADLDAMPTAERSAVLRIFGHYVGAPVALIHGDPDPSNLRIGERGRVGLLDWDESRVDVTWHDLSNLGVQVLDPEQHRGAQDLSNAWEAANGWVAEPGYARRRLAALRDE